MPKTPKNKKKETNIVLGPYEMADTDLVSGYVPPSRNTTQTGLNEESNRSRRNMLRSMRSNSTSKSAMRHPETSYMDQVVGYVPPGQAITSIPIPSKSGYGIYGQKSWEGGRSRRMRYKTNRRRSKLTRRRRHRRKH
jgi:hypothetical protein